MRRGGRFRRPGNVTKKTLNQWQTPTNQQEQEFKKTSLELLLAVRIVNSLLSRGIYRFRNVANARQKAFSQSMNLTVNQSSHMQIQCTIPMPIIDNNWRNYLLTLKTAKVWNGKPNFDLKQSKFRFFFAETSNFDQKTAKFRQILTLKPKLWQLLIENW